MRELQTGDELISTTTIETDKSGMVNIYFPDGSVARSEASTRFTLREASYDPKNEKLIVKIELAAGRGWSKIIHLATPDSLWEVRTSNAVATGRGTAFGFGYFNGRSRIFGSEHEVSVAALDPETNTAIQGTERTVSPNKLFEVKEGDVKKIKTNPRLAAIVDIPEDLKNEEFVKRNEDADRVIDQKLNELKGSGLEDKEVRNVFREDSIKQFREEIRKQENNDREINALDAPLMDNKEEKIKDSGKALDTKTENPNIRNQLYGADAADTVEAGAGLLQNIKNQLDAPIVSGNILESIDAALAEVLNPAPENPKIESQLEAVPIEVASGISGESSSSPGNSNQKQIDVPNVPLNRNVGASVKEDSVLPEGLAKKFEDAPIDNTNKGKKDVSGSKAQRRTNP